MASNITAKVGVEGAGEFKKSISEINGSLKTMGAEMAAVTSEFSKNANSSKALKAQNEVLEKQMDALSKKAELQKNRLAELDKQGVDPTDASYQKLQQELYKTEAEMNKTSAAIDQNTEKLKHHGKTAEEAHAAHAEAAKKAAAAVAGVVAAVAAVGAGLVKLTLDAASAADELNTLSVKTGISTDELQKLQYAAGTVDVSVETVAGAMGKLTKSMSSAADGSGATADAFAKLGVAVKNDDGTFRERNEVFNEAIAALGTITDETERDATAMQIFGKSAMELNPLIEGGAEALQSLGDHAEEAGLILSGDALNSLATLNDRFDVLKQTLGLAGQQFLSQFAQPLTKAIDTVIGYVERLVQAFQSGGFKGLADEAGTVATEIAAKFNEILPDIAAFATELIMTLTEGLISMLPDVVKSAITIITTLAQGLAETLPELIPVAVDAILELVDTLTDPDNLGNLIDAAIEIIIALANGLINALPKLIAKAPEIIANLVTALVENVPKLLTAALEIITTIASGIIDNLGKIFEAAGQIVSTVWDGITSLVSTIWDIGTNIVEGIWQGISNGFTWITEKIRGWVGNVLDFFKSALGIASPSKVFADVIGKNMALGIGTGFENTMDKVERDMMSSIPVPEVDANVTGNYDGLVGASNGMNQVVIGFDIDDEGLARFLHPYLKSETARLGTAMVAG